MEWWGWIAWAVSLVSAAVALVFGIRAERRAAYRPLWLLKSGPSIINRTGEDATNVRVFIDDGKQTHSFHRENIAPDEEVQLEGNFGRGRVFIVWLRPSTDRLYWWPEAARGGTRTMRQLHRAVRREDRKVNRSRPQLGNLSPEATSQLRWYDWRP